MKTDILNTPQKRKNYKKPVLKLHGTVSKITKLSKLGSEYDGGSNFNFAG
jgi:hypothetical protein